MSQGVYGERRERLTRIVAAASLVASAIYLGWRWGWTLDGEGLWFSLPLVLAETYGFLAAALLTYTGWRLHSRHPLPPLPDRTVDVVITTSDEPIAIIRRSALAARDIGYSHTTWLLASVHRADVHALALELGIHYLQRPDHAAGERLNHALQQSSGEFMLLLDACHIAQPSIVDQLIGFFTDERLAFAQSPQQIGEDGGFSDADVRDAQGWDRQLFSSVLQSGRDRHDAALLAGSCAMIRRAAIDEVGGFASETPIVGAETSILLHSRGWHSAYLAEILAFDVAPGTVPALTAPALHRAQGAMRALRRYQPLAMPGLTVAQRLEYFHTFALPLGGLQRLIVYLAPIVFLTTGVFPVRASIGRFAVLFIPAACLRAISYRMLMRGHESALHAERRWMATFATQLRAVRSYLAPRRPIHSDCPGDPAESPLHLVAPQLALIGATVLALAWATYARSLGYDADVPGWGSLALLGAVLIAVWHTGVAGYVAQRSLAGRPDAALDPAHVAPVTGTGHRTAESDPEHAIEMEITGEFSFPMELSVGATFVIGESGRVVADIATVHAIVLGFYSGTLRASGSIRVGPNARIEGRLETPDLEIAEGAAINGSRASGHSAGSPPSGAEAVLAD
jgi:cellulose synthase (UDP-forming)